MLLRSWRPLRAVHVRATTSVACRSFASDAKQHRVLFFGTDDVSVATLEKLYANSQQQDSGRIIDSIDVICPSDRKVGSGRGKRQDPVPVKRFALDHGLDVFHTPPHLKSLKHWAMPTAERSYDVGVVVSFGYLMHPHMLTNLARGAINMHPSLLPAYRGPAPVHHALLHGDTTTGVSVIEIDPRAFDVGRILLQKPFVIPDGIQCKALSQQLAAFGADCVLETLGDLDARKATATIQIDARATKAPKISTADGVLNLQSDSAEQIYRRWQALGDSVGVSVAFQHKIVKLVDVHRPPLKDVDSDVIETLVDAPSGAFVFDKMRRVLWLKCACKSWLWVASVQLADKKVINAVDFANGLRLKHKQTSRFETRDDLMSKL